MVLVCSILFNNLLLRFQRRINTAAVLTMMIATTHTVHKFFVKFFPFYFRPLSFFFCIFVFQFTIFYFIVLHFRILWLVNLFCSICTCMDNYSACIFRFFFSYFSSFDKLSMQICDQFSPEHKARGLCTFDVSRLHDVNFSDKIKSEKTNQKKKLSINDK